MGATSILFSGRNGGEAKEVAQVHVLVPSDHMQQIEDIHAMLNHIIFMALKERIAQYDTEHTTSESQ